MSVGGILLTDSPYIFQIKPLWPWAFAFSPGTCPVCFSALSCSASAFPFHLTQCFLFQIDHTLLQQTLQQGSLLSHPLSVDTGLISHSGSQLMSTADPSVPANVVIHPLTSLALQPSTITPAQVTMAGLSEQEATGMFCC